MRRNQDDDRILRQISRRRPSRRQYSTTPLWLFLAAAIVVLCFVLILALPGREKPQETPSVTVTDDSGNVVGTLPPGETLPPELPEYSKITVPSSDVHRGDLILVNYQYRFVFQDDADIVNIYENKTENYKVAQRTLELDARVLGIFNEMLDAFVADKDRRDVIINSGFRNEEDQTEIYENYKKWYGQDYADSYVSDPGHSEHHTGYAVDMAVYTDDGVSLTFDKHEDFSWFTHAAHEFGFILRYPEYKKDITKIAYEPWHFRYVGKPHAYYMYANDLCLEEYTEFIKQYTYSEDGETHLKFRDNEEQAWEVYYIPASDEENTLLYVPTEREYTLSGNNVDGFVIAAKAE